MREILNVDDWVDYEKVTNLDIEYVDIKPKKNSNNIYSSQLKEPIRFYLPRSDVHNLYKDEYNEYYIDYNLDSENQTELIEFLENMDSLCISEASKNSEVWFKKKLDEETLIKYFNSIYTVENDEDETQEELSLPINIEEESVEDINNFNQDETAIMIVKIIGIEFFKKTFRWKLKFDSVIYQTDKDDAQSGYESEELDFSKIMERDDNSYHDNNSDNEEDDKVAENKSLNNEIVNTTEDTTSINSNMINNLAKDDSISMVNEISRTESNNLKLDDSALEEITSIISQKRSEAQHYKINSERALKASESLSLKVASVNNEISAYEEKLKILSQRQ